MVVLLLRPDCYCYSLLSSINLREEIRDQYLLLDNLLFKRRKGLLKEKGRRVGRCRSLKLAVVRFIGFDVSSST